MQRPGRYSYINECRRGIPMRLRRFEYHYGIVYPLTLSHVEGLIYYHFRVKKKEKENTEKA